MTVFYGIDQTTDLRHPETKVVRLSSRKAALDWLAKKGELAWSGAARHDIPGPQQNFHHRLRSAYEMPPRWRPPSKKALREKAWNSSTSSYPRNESDMLANAVYKDGEELLR